MAVEILILSGVRQGERVVLDATNFRVGTNPDCAVFFDPLLDTTTANRSASFRLMEDGWYIVHTTGTILINHRAVTGPTRIRSGDVVRMSESGPDFSFRIVAGTAFQGTKSPAVATNSPIVSAPLGDSSAYVGLPVDSPVTMDPTCPSASVQLPRIPSISAPQDISTLSIGAGSDPGRISCLDSCIVSPHYAFGGTEFD